MKIFPALMFCFYLWPAHADEIAIGRLFFTPGERTALDKARQEKPVPKISEETLEPVEPLLSVNGIVKRHDGKSTVWVNAKPIQEGDPQVKISSSNSGKIVLKRSNGQGVAIEPGQFFDAASRKVIAPVSISHASKPSH